MPGPRTIFHVLVAIHFWFGCYYDWFHVKIPSKAHRMGSSFGRSHKLKFLTFWDALLQAAFFTICVLNDVIGTNDNVPNKPPLIRKFKDGLLACLAFPLSMFVGITFWGLYAVDRELVFPKVLDEFFPTWLNHVMHTNIMIFTLIELATSFRRYPPRKIGLSILIVFMLTYLIWMHVIYVYSGFWVYPIFEVLNWPMRVVFHLSLLGLVMGLYITGEKLSNVIWAKQLKAISVDSRKKGK